MTVNDTTKSSQGKLLVVLAVLASLGLSVFMLMNPGSGVMPPAVIAPPATNSSEDQKGVSSELAAPTAQGTSDASGASPASPELPPIPASSEAPSKEASDPETSGSTTSN